MLPKIVDDISKSKHVAVGKIIADGALDSKLFLNAFQTMAFCHVLK
jgi:hypothetical protein